MEPDQSAALRMPASVQLAEKLMYAGAALAVIHNVVRLFLRDQVADALAKELGDQDGAATMVEQTRDLNVGMLLTALVTALIWILVARLCASGSRFGRPIASFLGAIGAFSGGMAVLGHFYLPITLSSLLTAAIAVLVVVLLWRPDSSAFYAAHRQATLDAKATAE